MVYHNSASACDRHLAKHLRDVLGNADSKNVKVMRVLERAPGENLHFCSCGKRADWHVVADRGRG